MSSDYGQTFITYPVNFKTFKILMNSDGSKQFCVDIESYSIYNFNFTINSWDLSLNLSRDITPLKYINSCINGNSRYIVISDADENDKGNIYLINLKESGWLKINNPSLIKLNSLQFDFYRLYGLNDNNAYQYNTGYPYSELLVNPTLNKIQNDKLSCLCNDLNGNFIYLISQNGNFYKSTDGGDTWMTPKNISDQYSNSMPEDYKITCDNSGKYILINFLKDIYISSDYGETFSLQKIVTDNNNEYIYNPVLISGDSHTIIVTKIDVKTTDEESKFLFNINIYKISL
jgi:hypothetical protein